MTAPITSIAARRFATRRSEITAAAFVTLTVLLALTRPAAAQGIVNGSFEAGATANGAYAYLPTDQPPWLFSGTAGVTGAGSALSTANSPPPEGRLAAFVEGTGALSQPFTLAAAGDHIVSFRVINRADPGCRQALRVSIDGTPVLEFSVPDAASQAPWMSVASPALALAAGAHALRIEGTGSGNCTAFVDDVQLQRITGTGGIGSFNAFDTAASAGSASGAIQTKVAGSAFSLAVVALNAARTAVNIGYSGSVTVQLLDARNNSGALDGNGCRATWVAIAEGAASGSFGSGNAGRINVPLAVNDAWRELRVRITAGASTGCSSDGFAVRPAALVVSALDADWQNAFTGGSGARRLDNTSAAGGIVHAAGRPFTLSATAVNAGGAPVANYDGAPALRAGSLACTLPAGCVTGSLAFSGWSAAGTGERRAVDAVYSEAGAFRLELEDTTFAEVDAADTPSALRTVAQSGGALGVGRFVPAWFDVVPSGAAPALRTMATSDSACSAAPAGTPRRSFTYVGQAFGWATPPRATILARNAAGATTANYRGALWKLGPAQIARSIDATDTSPSGQTATVSIAGLSAGDVVSGDNGSGTVTASLSDAITYVRSATVAAAPFTARISAQIQVVDSTESGPQGNPAAIGTGNPACFNGGGSCAAPGSGIAFDSAVPGFPGNVFRYGRLRLANANGSELIALPLPILVEYWNGSAWVPSTLDFCTTVAAGRVALSNYQGNLDAGKTAPSIAGPVIAGTRNIVFSAPGAGNSGSVDLAIDLSASAANLPWLQGAWTGNAFTQNPAARATFGTRALPSPIIFRRERF